MRPKDLEDFFPRACPYTACPSRERGAPPAAFRRRGTYDVFKRDGSVRGVIRRFVCSSCERSFSARRFAVEFRMQVPELTPWMLRMLVSGVSHRQAARHGLLSRSSIRRRLRRYGLHGHRLLRWMRMHRLRGALAGTFVMDEAETFETSRLFQPLTVPVVVERESRYVVDFNVATMAPRLAREDPRRIEWEKRNGRRRSRSRSAVTRCLAALVKVAKRGSELRTDEKPSYGEALRRADPQGKLTHRTYSSRLPRGPRNPLFAINHTLAMVRDGLARMRRRTWCVTKKRGWLWLQLGVYFAWKNLSRVRFNEEKKTPAQRAGVTRRAWGLRELVKWRLDLGVASVAPEVP